MKGYSFTQDTHTMARQETPFNLNAGKLSPVAAPTGAILKPQVQKPAIQQTFGEIAAALKAFIPALEAEADNKIEQEVTDAKATAANMTVQEAISFAYSSTNEQSKQLGTTSLRAHSAANAAIGAKVMSGQEFSQDAINALYDPTLSASARNSIVANERIRLMTGLGDANPIIKAAANEVLDGYSRQVMSNATSIRHQRLANIAIETTYDTAHDTVSNQLSGLSYGGSSTESVIASITSLDKTQRDNFAGQAGVNQAFDNAIKDSIVGFAGDNPDEAHLVLEGLVEKGFYSREQVTEIQDKVQSQADVRQRRLDRAENDKFSEVQDLADTLLFQNLQVGIEPGTSVTQYLSSDAGVALVAAIQAKAGELGLAINDGRLNSILRQTATGVFRDAGAGEYSIGAEAEKALASIGASEDEYNNFLAQAKYTFNEGRELSPEQRARASQIFGQNKARFNAEIQQRLVTVGADPKYFSSTQQKDYDLAIANGDKDAVQGIIDSSIKTWDTSSSAYEEMVNSALKSTFVENISFNGADNLQEIIENAAGTQDLSFFGISDEDIRTEAESVIKSRVKNIPNWNTMTLEEKSIALDATLKRKVRMSETSYDDVIKSADSLPAFDTEDLEVFTQETFKPAIDQRRTAKDKFLTNLEPRISDRNLVTYLTDLGNRKYGSDEEIADTKVVYGEAFYGRTPLHSDIKPSLATPLISLGVDIEGLVAGAVYDDPALPFNQGRTGTLGVDPRKIIPTNEGTDGLDMSYLIIVDKDGEPTYESKLDDFLQMDSAAAKESDIGKIIQLYGPKSISIDPKDPLTIRYVDYLKRANEISNKRSNDNSKKALYGVKIKPEYSPFPRSRQEELDN